MTDKWLTLLYSVFYAGLCINIEGQETKLTISPAYVNEGSPQNLTCKNSGSKTVNSVSWYANDINEGVLKVNGDCSKFLWGHENLHNYSCDVTSRTFTLTILSVKASNRSDIWRCTISFVGVSERENSNNVSPSIKVLIRSVTMTLPQSSTVTIQENSTQLFRCVTSGGLPKPIVKWYNDSKTPADIHDDKEVTSLLSYSYSNTIEDLFITTSSITLTASKYDNQMSIYCSAYVSADQTPLISTLKPKLKVLYAPDGPPKLQGFADGATYRVIENRQGHLTCNIKGGNPSPILSWTCYNTGISDIIVTETVSKSVRWTAKRGQDRTCTCRSTHPSGNASVGIQVLILYPPSTPAFYIKDVEVSGIVQVIKNNTISITCRSFGKPNIIEYTWKHSLSITPGSVLTTSSVNNVDNYTCEVENSMNPTDGNYVRGKNSSSLRFETLYPPEVDIIQNRSVSEGSTFVYDCPVKLGNPNVTSFKWRRGDITVSNLQRLTIQNMSRTDVAFYTCTAENLMKQTGEQIARRGSDSQSFYLNVWRKPDKPTNFNVERTLVTESSFTVQWKSGKNNGPKQTFILKYRKELHNKWIIVEIPDSGETVINYTVSNLSSGTNYEVALFASNQLGNSTETDMLLITTKCSHDKCISSNGSDTAIIVGVVFGLVSVVISVYASYVTVILRRIKTSQEPALSSRSQGNTTSMHTYTNLSFSTTTTNQQLDTEQREVAEYTELNKQLRNDNSTYDHIDTAQ